MDYSNIPSKHNFGENIDHLIRVRENARYNFAKSRLELIDLGAKTYSNGELMALPNLDLKKYEACKFQEFCWEAKYNDGTEIKQFQGSLEHHFGDLDQQRLSTISWISNFTSDTSNVEKRVIVTLDFKTGKFIFMNGLALGEVRNVSDAGFPVGIEGEKKLILKMVKRESSGVSSGADAVSEITRYYRYLLGWEFGAEKIILCVEPNGYTHLWHQD